MKIKRIKRRARKPLRRNPGLKRQSKSALLKDCKRKPGLKRQSKSALLKDCKRKPGLKQQSKSVLLKDCKRVSWTVLKEIARIRKQKSTKMGLQLGTLKFKVKNCQGK